jgi:hypothetical protein
MFSDDELITGPVTVVQGDVLEAGRDQDHHRRVQFLPAGALLQRGRQRLHPVRVSVKGTKTGWVALNRNWGANWQCNSALFGQALSFSVTSTGGQTLYMTDVVPSWWQIGMVFASNYNFYY